MAVLLAAACAIPDGQGDSRSDPHPASVREATPIVGAARSQRQARIINPTAGWPREVADVNGRVTIPAPPTRIHTLSVGYDEITFRLVDRSRIIAVGRSSTNPELSNIASEAALVAHHIGRNAEEVVALQPDLVVASPFSNADLVDALRKAGLPLVVVDLVSSVDAHEENIRLLAYIYGEEDRGEALVAEVRERLAALRQRVGGRPPETRPRVLLLSGSTAAGSGTNEDGVLQLAGARNAAAEAGLVGNRPLSLEIIARIEPDFIVVAESSPSETGRPAVVSNQPVIDRLRAAREGRVIRIKTSLLLTLSHWNVVAAEQLATALYP